MLEAGQQAGIPWNEDYNSGNPEGIGRIQANVKDGNRFNTWHAYLKPVADHDNLTIITDAKVQRVIVDGDTVTGVEIRGESGIDKLHAKETILCAGALNSPEILLRSGIGPAEELQDLGVTVTHDLSGVGKNLYDNILFIV